MNQSCTQIYKEEKMIQELFGGAGLIVGERKFSITGTILEGTPSSSPSPSPSPSASSSTATTTTTNSTTAPGTNSSSSTTSSTSESLRCPRCDSSNTKFCYYNNYNLTQPRHFCKTCRRYWTKGGALRNVPIGGGCRKNKSTSAASSVGKSSSTSKLKSVVSELGRSSFGNGFDHELPSSPILWASPQNSHILAILRAAQNPNPNPSALSSTLSVKEEGGMAGAHLMTEPTVVTGGMSARTLGLDSLTQAPSLGLCSPFWKNSQHQAQQQQQQQPQNGFIVGEAQSAGLQELYQRLRSSVNFYNTADNPPVVLGNVASASSTSSSSTILESAPVAGGELGVYWNPSFSWSDLSTTNGAYP